MKIKIDESNRQRIDAELQGTGRTVATKHTATFEQIAAVCAAAEARLAAGGLPKAARAGAIIRLRSGGRVPASYKFRRIVSVVSLERGASAWFLTECYRASVHNDANGFAGLVLTDAQRLRVSEHLMTAYKAL